MTTVSREIGRVLREAGVRYAMGHPGGEVVELIEGLRAEGIEFILTHHEATAAFMADAIGYYTRIPGVCVATLGPGATNLITGIAHAYLDRAPVIALTGQLPASRYDMVTHQKIDLGAVFAPITKWHARVQPNNVRAVTSRALRVATRRRAGPVHLEVASDVADQESSDRGDYVTHRLTEANGVVEGAAAAAALIASKRPLLLAGMDALSDGVAESLRALAEGWSIPVIVTPKAKGVLPEDHPLFLGTIEMLGTDRLFALIEQCDLVMMIGMDPVEFDRDWIAAAKVVHIGPLPNDDLYFASEIELVGSVAQTLGALMEAAGTPSARWDDDEVGNFRDEMRRRLDPQVDGLSAQALLRELRSVLRADAIVTCDVGQNKSVTGQCWPVYQPRSFFMSNGLSSMGYGLPAAMALKLLEPDRQVACIIGDGGFTMYLGEIETAVRRGLAVVVVVLVDGALTQIRMNQARRGLFPTGTEFGVIDYVGLARALGADGFEVTNIKEARDAVQFASGNARRPTVIAANINPRCYEI